MKLSGRITRSTDECEMSRSCQSAMFSNAAIALPRSSRARPTICSQPIGLRLCGIADEPFCPLPNGSSTSPISVFCSPRISSANFSSEAAVIASADISSAWRSRWITCDETGAGSSPSRSQTARLDRRIEMREGPHGAGDLADRDDVAGAQDAIEIAPQLGVPERELEAERHRLGVHAVRAPDHRRHPVLVGARAHRLHQGADVLDDEAAGLAHLERLGGVDDVGGREAEVQVARRGPDLLGDGGREGDHVVLRDRFDLFDARRCRTPPWRAARPRPRAESSPASAIASAAASSTSSHVS